ncbi:MAG: hypothetical protein WEB93_05540 [Sphingomonadales bacterium]
MSNAQRPDGRGRGPGSGPGSGKGQGGYIVEFLHVGNSVKVSAVDPRTNTEVSIVGSPAMSQAMLSRNAIRKLEYVLAKKRG